MIKLLYDKAACGCRCPALVLDDAQFAQKDWVIQKIHCRPRDARGRQRTVPSG